MALVLATHRSGAMAAATPSHTAELFVKHRLLIGTQDRIEGFGGVGALVHPRCHGGHVFCV
jgi:hypothetical protein